MTLSGFNQEGGTVTGNIENLTIESKQNTSITKGSTKGGSLSIAPNGMPSGSANYSQTNGERRVVDNASTFIIGDGSNLKVGKVENTASAIGATGNIENFFPDEFEIQKRFKDSLDKINCLEANNTKDKIQVFIKNFDELRSMDRYNLWVYIVENILIKKFIEGQEIDIYAVFEDNIW